MIIAYTKTCWEYEGYKNVTKIDARDDFGCVCGVDLYAFGVSGDDFSFLAFSDPRHLWRRKMSKMKNQDLKQQKRTNRHHKRIKNRPAPRISSNFGVLYINILVGLHVNFSMHR